MKESDHFLNIQTCSARKKSCPEECLLKGIYKRKNPPRGSEECTPRNPYVTASHRSAQRSELLLSSYKRSDPWWQRWWDFVGSSSSRPRLVLKQFQGLLFSLLFITLEMKTRHAHNRRTRELRISPAWSLCKQQPRLQHGAARHR